LNEIVQEYFNENEQVEEVEEDLNAFHLKSNRRKPEHKITFRESSIQHQLPRPSDKLFSSSGKLIRSATDETFLQTD
jgi:hypothetical protein